MDKSAFFQANDNFLDKLDTFVPSSDKYEDVKLNSKKASFFGLATQVLRSLDRDFVIFGGYVRDVYAFTLSDKMKPEHVTNDIDVVFRNEADAALFTAKLYSEFSLDMENYTKTDIRKPVHSYDDVTHKYSLHHGEYKVDVLVHSQLYTGIDCIAINNINDIFDIDKMNYLPGYGLTLFTPREYLSRMESPLSYKSFYTYKDVKRIMKMEKRGWNFVLQAFPDPTITSTDPFA